MPDQGSLNNYHVFQHFQWLSWIAARQRRYMAQLHFYTQAQLELDINWKPEHLTEVCDD